MDPKWYISIERRGFTPARMEYNCYAKATREYNQFNLLDDSEASKSDGRVWLCRIDGGALKVNYFTLNQGN